MKLLDELHEIIKRIEVETGIHLEDVDFADDHEEIVHVFLHETCHAAISNRIPWIHDLTDEQHTVVDEVLARLLENTISPILEMPNHMSEEHVRELEMYPVKITVEQFKHLNKQWQQQYKPRKDLEGMGYYILNHLFPGNRIHERR